MLCRSDNIIVTHDLAQRAAMNAIRICCGGCNAAVDVQRDPAERAVGRRTVQCAALRAARAGTDEAGPGCVRHRTTTAEPLHGVAHRSELRQEQSDEGSWGAGSRQRVPAENNELAVTRIHMVTGVSQFWSC